MNLILGSAFRSLSVIAGLVLSASIFQPTLAAAKMKAPQLPYKTVDTIVGAIAPKLMEMPGVVGVGVTYCGDVKDKIIGIVIYWDDQDAMDSMCETSIDISLGTDLLVKVPLCSKFTGKIVPL